MKKNGFTLVEIAVVTIVIGLLATLGSMAILKGIKHSRIKHAETDLQMISAAVLQLAWDTGDWPNGRVRTSPGSAEVWDISGDTSGVMGSDGSYNDWKGPYYDGETLDPWGNPYFFDPDYLISGVNHIVVGSFGPNGKGQNVYDDDDIYVLLDD